MSNNYIQVFTTIEKREDARKIAGQAVEKRLAACVQVLGPLTSTFWWENKIDEAEEWLLIMKTRDDLYSELERVIRENHPYEVPEIIATPVVSGHRRYLDWIDREVKTGTNPTR